LTLIDDRKWEEASRAWTSERHREARPQPPATEDSAATLLKSTLKNE